MKFQKYLQDTCVPEWRTAYVDYKAVKTYIKGMTRRDDDRFLRRLQQELIKNQTFFMEQVLTLPGRLAYLENRLGTEIVKAGVGNDVKELKYLRFLFREFHKYCCFLENFQKLNKIAYAKITKKYDKVFDSDIKETLSYIFTDDFIFLDNRPRRSVQRCEYDLTVLFDFCKQHCPHVLSKHDLVRPSRTLAMRYIRGKDLPQDEFTFMRVGCYIGCSLPLIIASVVSIARKGRLENVLWRQVLYMYGGLFIIVLSFFGFATDLFIWRKLRINYIFILELNSRKTLTYRQFTEFAAWSLFLWSLSFYFAVFQLLDRWLSFEYLPLILIAVYLVILFLPLPVFYHTSRKWFIKSMGRVITPGMRKVTFRDFFIADLLISLTFFYSALYLTVCFYATGKASNTDGDLCSPQKSWITPLLIATPLVIRLIQCLRKYRDKQLKKDVYNAGKYTVAIVTVFASSFNSIVKGGFFFAIWLLLALTSTAYSYFWDIGKDWDIFADGKLIRKRFHYGAAAVNLLLRSTWILTINTFFLFDYILLSFLFGCLEVLRRYMWAVFRMELEHTQNVEQYRAIKDIPLLESEEN
jgi:xenotropic and polytropic retrovirus receptor 1